MSNTNDKGRQKSTAKSDKRGPYLSPLKRKDIVARRAAGQTVREVAAAEKCGTNTVTKVTNSPEGQEEMSRLGDEHTARLREELRGLVPAALRTLADSVENDPTMAFKILRGSGVARYKDESKVEISAADPYSKYSQAEKVFYLNHGRFPNPAEMGQATRESGEWEENQSESTPVQ